MRSFRLPAICLLIAGLVVAGLWLLRRPLTEVAVSRWLAGQGVEARYRVTTISPGAVTLREVSLGPAGSPDFTAERVEARVGWSPLRPRIDTVTLIRPSLRATITAAGGVSIGSLDRLLPARSATPQPLPDIDVTIVGGRLALATPAGALPGTLDGRGRLRAGFRGFGSIAPAPLAVAGCEASLGAVRFAVTTRQDEATVGARGSLTRLACAAASVEGVRWRVTATLAADTRSL